MSDLKPTVSLTSANGENMSRHQMLDWVNNMVNGHFKKIEEMASGVAYCQMMEMIFPNCINLKRVKMSAKLEHEFFHNMKLFQGALTRVKLDKTVPLDRLIKGRFQDNFEFLQWFKKFFDSQAPGLENIKSAANAVQPKPIKPRAMMKEEPSNDFLESQIDDLNTKIANTIEIRDQAYEKLRKIEILLTETINKNEHVDFCNRVCEVLYKTDQNENVGTAGEDSLDSAIDDLNEGLY
ncbi:microtubule-associated protein RP/EB family member 1 [Drosophila novamexicana]|uniref:microtubule-associated protein RP/EB family member 1 n=1 Tax=Drosophila novamexicana TaxID=47314 RepID=UPI0011E5947F|nr:microtubule-associated protein RP/EB family member 1 [Drosophila novamexicana]XP_030557946.1 microtubule-associated protein RP/EB family member 1 [Drosophila novamexicana]